MWNTLWKKLLKSSAFSTDVATLSPKYILSGINSDFLKLQSYLINPVNFRLAKTLSSKLVAVSCNYFEICGHGTCNHLLI